MVIAIELKPEVEMQVFSQASKEGVTVESLLESVIESHFPPVSENPFYETASTDEWVKAFRDWAAAHSPILSVADDSRESIYEGRGE
ncbi:MAG TPA: hypothetical protein VFC63_01605 [Blastocatellia bacterium]|nr:hypothetical protein [Blastocatellia bacterium]